MNKKIYKSFVIVLSAVVLLTGCGSGVADSISRQYAFESAVTGDAGSQSLVYRAENQSVQEVAKILSKQAAPKEASKEDPERMFSCLS
jgi:poly-gamma-glutamate capsule biosynthesis protein CapA/YwtB (metallophosphatase superfamily)